MEHSFNASHRFSNRLADRISTEITDNTDQYFELYQQQENWNEKQQELLYNNRETINASSKERTARMFLLFVLVPVTMLIDWSSISGFIQYLSVSAGGGLMSWLISFVGIALFTLLELAAGWIILYAHNKPALRMMAIILAVILTITPSFLVVSTYFMAATKTVALLFKTIALVAISIIVHAIFFLMVSQVWAAIHSVGFFFRKKALERKDPRRRMKGVKKTLCALYPDFDHYILPNYTGDLSKLLSNRGYYLRGKLSQGHSDDYDLSDYNPDTFYEPIQATQNSSTKYYH